MSESMSEGYDRMKAEIPQLKAEIEGLSLEVKEANEKLAIAEQEMINAVKAHEEAMAEAKKIEADLNEELALAEAAQEAAEKELSDAQAVIKVDPNLGDIDAGMEAVNEVVASEEDKIDHVAKLEEIQKEYGLGSSEAIAYFRKYENEIDKGE